MKNCKAPGADAIFAEVLKAGGDEMTKFLLMLFNNIWREENPPLEWSTPVHKKGNKTNQSNYRASHCYQYLVKYSATYFSKE